MAIAKKEMTGLIQGRTVVLEEDSGLPDGSRVTVQIAPRKLSDEEALERLRSCAGAWADDAEALDRYLEWNRAQRKVNRPEIDG